MKLQIKQYDVEGLLNYLSKEENVLIKKKSFIVQAVILGMIISLNITGCAKNRHNTTGSNQVTEQQETSKESSQEKDNITETSIDNETSNSTNKESNNKTEGTADALVRINPSCRANFTWGDSGIVTIKDNTTNAFYYFDETTIIDSSLPCYEEGLRSIEWLQSYLKHDAIFDESDTNDPNYCSGLAGGDIWEIIIDDNNHIVNLISIKYWD